MTRGYLFSLLSAWNDSMTGGRRIALFFYFPVFFFFFLFARRNIPLFSRERDFSRSTVAQFSKIRERFSFARDANHPSISRDYPAPRFDLWSGKEVYSFFLSGGFLVDLRMDRRWNFEIETYSVLNIKEVII